MAEARYTDYPDDLRPRAGAAPSRAAQPQRAVNIAGALTSVLLVAGLAVWGYRVAVRDVTGVPVVRALEGPMRIAPADPGGDVAAHQGLAVNAIPAVGTALPPPDTLVLAPRPIDLADEDVAGLAATTAATTAAPVAPVDLPPAAPMTDVATLVAPVPLAPEPAPAPAATDTDIIDQALAEALGESVADTPAADAATVDGEFALVTEAGPAPNGAVLRSPRPVTRPRLTSLNPVPVAAPAAPDVAEVDPDTLTPGTRLVQLGAFDDAATARAEWDRLVATFGTLMDGKARVVQAAQSGGRTFYRLRAHGFADEADARRFCSALLAEEAACIPVALR